MAIMVTFMSLSAEASSSREKLKGYFLLKDKEIYFTEIFHSTAPVYKVKWWNGKRPIPFCAINKNLMCQAVEISFERQVLQEEKEQVVILANAIFANQVDK